MANKLLYSPAQCPIDIEVLRRHANVDDPTDDDLIMGRAAAATELVEQHLGRLLLTRTVTWTVAADERGAHALSGPAFGRVTCPSGFGPLSLLRGWVELPRPASAITEVKLNHWDGAAQVLVAGTDYQSDLLAEPARIRLRATPYAGNGIANMQVSFSSGYGSSPDDVPKSIQHAILLIVTNFGENRGEGEFTVWTSAVDALLAPYRIEHFD